MKEIKGRSPKAIKALTFGEILFDIINGSACPGGGPLNLAANLAKLGESKGAKPTVILAVFLHAYFSGHSVLEAAFLPAPSELTWH